MSISKGSTSGLLLYRMKTNSQQDKSKLLNEILPADIITEEIKGDNK